MYGGFVRLESVDASPITIEAASEENGYGAGAAGTRLDVEMIGFNESRMNAKGQYQVKGAGPVDGTLLQASNGLKINGVLIDRLAEQQVQMFTPLIKLLQLIVLLQKLV